MPPRTRTTDIATVPANDVMFDVEPATPGRYDLPPTRSLRNVSGQLLRIREVTQLVRDDIAAALLEPADGEYVRLDPTLAAAVVALANCVEALAQINTP